MADVPAAVFESVVEGSPITGAPGQPVDDGDLKESWTNTRTGPATAEIASDSPYAEAVEENWSGVAFKNHGPHSKALTEVGFPDLVADVVRQWPEEL